MQVYKTSRIVTLVKGLLGVPMLRTLLKSLRKIAITLIIGALAGATSVYLYDKSLMNQSGITQRAATNTIVAQKAFSSVYEKKTDAPGVPDKIKKERFFLVCDGEQLIEYWDDQGKEIASPLSIPTKITKTFEFSDKSQAPEAWIHDWWFYNDGSSVGFSNRSEIKSQTGFVHVEESEIRVVIITSSTSEKDKELRTTIRINRVSGEVLEEDLDQYIGPNARQKASLISFRGNCRRAEKPKI